MNELVLRGHLPEKQTRKCIFHFHQNIIHEVPPTKRKEAGAMSRVSTRYPIDRNAVDLAFFPLKPFPILFSRSSMSPLKRVKLTGQPESFAVISMSIVT